MRKLYLIMAILGGLVPFAFYAVHFATQGLDPLVFLSASVATPAVRGLTADLVLASVVFWIAIIHRRRAKGGPNPAVFIALNLLVGLACAIPAYLFANSRPEGTPAQERP